MVGSHWRLNVFDFFQIGNRRAINSTNPLPIPLLSPPLSSLCRRPWPFELNSNFNAILHIQAHYSRLPTYSEPTQSLLNCAFLICRRVQLCLPLAPPSRCPHHLLPPLLGCRRLRVAILPSCALQLNYAGSGSALLAWRWTANVAVSCDLAQTHTPTHTHTRTQQQRIDSRRFRGIRILTFFVQDWEHLQLQLQENNGRDKLRPHSSSGQAGIMRRQSFRLNFSCSLERLN